MGSVPVICVGEKQYAQTRSVARYAAAISGFYPESNVGKMVCDLMHDTIEDIHCAFPSKDERAEFLSTGKGKTALDNLEKYIGENQTKDGYVFGEKTSYGDFVVWAYFSFWMSSFMAGVPEDAFDHLPRVMAIVNRIRNLDSLQDYYANLDEAVKPLYAFHVPQKTAE